MNSRFLAGFLGIFFGIIWAQKFYLWRKKEGILSLLFCWTYIPAILWFLEGIWFLTRSEKEWEEYFELLKHPKSSLQDSILKTTPYLRNYEKEVKEGIQKMKKYPGRTTGVILGGIILLVMYGQSHGTPVIKAISETNTNQTRGVYNFRFEASPANKVMVDSVEVNATGKNTYEVPVSLEKRSKMVHISAENGGRRNQQDITITRAPTVEEIAMEEKVKQDEENKRIADEKAKAEAIEKQKAEGEACMKNEKCRQAKEDQKKDAELQVWLDKKGTSAWTFCKERIQKQLKSPSTADFPWTHESWVAGGFIYIRSYVDAQNSFWAMLRSNFNCKLRMENIVEDDLRIVEANLE